MEVKKWYMSKTIWIAVAQAVLGIIAAIQVDYPAIAGAGWVAIIKSIADVVVRIDTRTAIVNK